MDPPNAEAFEEIFRETSIRVFAYAARHVGLDQAEDIVAETYTIAWRRFSTIPSDPLPWLLTTARNVIRNQRRSKIRAEQNWARAVRELWHEPALSPDQIIEAREAAIAALDACSDLEREAVLLVAWDGLSPSAAAAVAGCTRRAFAVRLSRARARLRNSLDQEKDTEHQTTHRRAIRLTDPAKETS